MVGTRRFLGGRCLLQRLLPQLRAARFDALADRIHLRFGGGRRPGGRCRRGRRFGTGIRIRVRARIGIGFGIHDDCGRRDRTSSRRIAGIGCAHRGRRLATDAIEGAQVERLAPLRAFEHRTARVQLHQAPGRDGVGGFAELDPHRVATLAGLHDRHVQLRRDQHAGQHVVEGIALGVSFFAGLQRKRMRAAILGEQRARTDFSVLRERPEALRWRRSRLWQRLQQAGVVGQQRRAPAHAGQRQHPGQQGPAGHRRQQPGARAGAVNAHAAPPRRRGPAAAAGSRTGRS
jgi:hypothetical protein